MGTTAQGFWIMLIFLNIWCKRMEHLQQCLLYMLYDAFSTLRPVALVKNCMAIFPTHFIVLNRPISTLESACLPKFMLFLTTLRNF